ncbi:MAG: helix-turn-helix domain-containing protein [Chloroflexia bacterium]|nr:helix-turn-helix domain-containing protein [Chloroflexia bacterium]
MNAGVTNPQPSTATIGDDSDDLLSPEERREAGRYAYRVWWSAADNAYLAQAEGLPGSTAHGATEHTAIELAHEAAATALAGYRVLGWAPPPASGGGQLTARRTVVIEPPVYDADRIRSVRERVNASQTVFARLLGVSAQAVHAWERGQSTPSGSARRLLEVVERFPGVARPLLRDRHDHQP